MGPEAKEFQNFLGAYKRAISLAYDPPKFWEQEVKSGRTTLEEFEEIYRRYEGDLDRCRKFADDHPELFQRLDAEGKPAGEEGYLFPERFKDDLIMANIRLGQDLEWLLREAYIARVAWWVSQLHRGEGVAALR